MIPELVVTPVIVVVIQAVEGLLVVVPQGLIDKVVLNGNARMELIRVLPVADKQNIAHQRIQSVADVQLVAVSHALERGFYLSLSVKLFFQFVDVIVLMIQVLLAHTVSVLSEYAIYHPVGDKRCGEQLLLEAQPITLYLLAAHSQRRRELAQQSIHCIDGNFPDAEEAQHMVDAICVEVLRHLPEPAHPPLAAVGYHRVPVIRGETPVLSVGRESVGWCAGLTVKVKVARLHPGLHAVTTDADRYIALEYHLLATRILMRVTHLLVQVVLDIVPHGHVLKCLRAGIGQGHSLLVVEAVMIGPLAERRRAIDVPIVAEGCIGHQPVLVLSKECLKLVTAHQRSALLLIEQSQILHLGLVHALVIYLWQRVQFLAQCLKLGKTALVGQLGHIVQIHILRMQGVDADAVIWIRVGPRVTYVGVVDWQHLQHALTGLCHPVHHLLQVAEVAYSETLVAPEREYRYHRAGHSAVGYREISLT